MSELRWILSGLGVVAIAAIWWWSTRRSGQAPGNSELRESTVMPVQSLTPAMDGRDRPPEQRDRAEARDRTETRDRPDMRERTIAPLEPLSIRTADFEGVPVLDLPMMADPEPDAIEEADYIESSMPGSAMDPHFGEADAEPAEIGSAMQTPAPEQTPAPAAETYATQATLDLGSTKEHSDRPVEPSSPNVSEQQKIVTLRVCAVGEARWPGRILMAVLEAHGLAYGRYQVYHRKHADGRSIFYVASLIEPGTFDASRMAEEEFRGVSMFAVLPGPVEPLQAVDALLNTARELARDLSGTLQDAKGMPFSPQRIATLREDVARFQSARGPAA